MAKKQFSIAIAVFLGALVAGSGAMAREITVVSTAGPMPIVMGALISDFRACNREQGHDQVRERPPNLFPAQGGRRPRSRHRG
jgi:hypothetical protein